MNEYLNESQNKIFDPETTKIQTKAGNKNEMSDVIELNNVGDVHGECLRINQISVCKPITVNELYEEILFVILSNGYEKNTDNDSDVLIEYMRKVFEITKPKHFELLRNVNTKNPPQKTLRIEVDRAENLFSMDSNGLSDPFVTLYVDSNSTNRYNTAVVPSTLNPSWKEQFLIPIQQNPITEVLILELWDFDAAESVSEKMNKLVEVKGIRGFKKLLKEIALAASTGKHDNELIGRIEIPLKSIPATGLKSWYTLKKNSSNKNRGSILLHLYFSTEKNKVIAINEHINLLRIFLLYELKCMNALSYTWFGKFNPKAETIILRHSIQSNLSEIDSDLCQWEVYTKVHETHFLSLKLFNKLILKLMPIICEKSNNDESLCVQRFWEGYKRLLPSCFLIVRSIRSEKFEATYGTENLSSALEIIKKAEPHIVPIDVNLFPLHEYGWLGKTKETRKLNTDVVLKEAIQYSGLQFLNKQYENVRFTPESVVKDLIVIMRSIISDLQTAVELYDKLFYSKSSIKYATILYGLYHEQVAANHLPKIIEACNNLRQLNILDEELITVSNENVFTNGTLLFDLYLGFRRFANLGSALFSPPYNLDYNKFYASFYPAVPNWLNISVIKTLTRIGKAIELDEFHPYNNVMKYTSSALDTLSLFYQIKYFWEQLDWPNIEESYIFVEKIVNDVCRCCAFYANKLSVRIAELKDKDYNKQHSQGSKEYCYAINDINYIKESLPIFLKELKIDDILKKLADLRSTMEVERCSSTINNIICNTVDIADNNIFELIVVMAQSFLPMIKNIYQEGSDVSYNNSDRMDNLLKNFSINMESLRTELQKDSFSKLSRIVCNEVYVLIHDLIQKESNNYRQPSFFRNMHRISNIIIQMLSCETNDACTDDSLKEIDSELKLYAMETNDVIHHYYEDQLKIQNVNTQNEHGQLSIKASFLKDSLHVHILNAYKLLPTDSENSCNSYVKVYFSPAESFVSIQSLRTAVQNKTRCPLYDEQFFIKLSTRLRQNNSSVLIFCVKNKDLFSLSNNYIGECYLSFADIENATGQFRINLTKPKYSDTKIVHVLSSRTGDKLAKDFLRKLRQKSFGNNKTIFNL